MRDRRPGRGPRHGRGPAPPGRAVHPRREARGLLARAAGDRLDRRVPRGARRPRGRGHAHHRPGGAHRQPDGHRGRLPRQHGHRGVRPLGGLDRPRPLPRRRRAPDQRVRPPRRGAAPPPGGRGGAVHRHELRQHRRQRGRRTPDDHRVRPAAGRDARDRPRRLDRARGPVPQLHGRPDHPAHHRRRPRRARGALRGRRRLAGGLRAVLPVGARGPLRVRAARVRGGRRAGRRRRRAVRDDEAAPAQRLAPGAGLPRLPRRVPLRARGGRRRRVRGLRPRLHGRRGDPDAAAGPGRGPRRLQGHADRAVREPRDPRHARPAGGGVLGPDPHRGWCR